jgi:TolB-like protein/Flp pilus assembly protein TadD
VSSRNIFEELKRRNVYKVAVAYVVVSWLLIQAASIMLPAFEAPAWVMKILISALLIGFPIALGFSWAFEITPEGIKRESEIASDKSIAQHTGRKIVGLTVVVAVLAAALFAFQLLRPGRTRVETVGEAASFPPKQDGKLTASPATESLAGARPSTSNAPAMPDKSIAVLPFDNLSDDKANAYFAEGIQDEILTRLAKVADLKVISRTSTQHFKSAPENLREIAKQLGVMNVLEGSVQRSNDQVRVNVQLINALTDAHLWADMYDRKLTDIFTVESDIAKTIADTLQARLTGSEQRALAAHPTENPEAYQLYLHGRFFWNKRTAPDLRKAIDYFSKAIAKDPNYALAYAGLAQSWLLLPAYGGGSPADCFPESEKAVKKALALDETCVDAHAALGDLKAVYYFDYPGSKTELERAIQLDPNSATAHHWLANQSLANLGETERALTEMKRAMELDPLSLVINTNLGVAYYSAGQIDDAIRQLRRTVEMDGNFYFARWNLGLALELKGETSEAIAEYKKAIELSSGDPTPIGYLGRLYGLTGRKDEAHKILEDLRRMREENYTSAYSLACVYVGLGEKDEAMNWLERGYQEHDGFNLGAIRVDPVLAPLRGYPRFEALAEKIVPLGIFAGAETAIKK